MAQQPLVLEPNEVDDSGHMELNRLYLGEQIALSNQTIALLENLSSKLATITRKYVKNGEIADKSGFDAAVLNEINKYTIAYTDGVMSAQEEIMRVRAVEQLALLTRAGMPKETVKAITKAWEVLLQDYLKDLPGRKWDDDIALRNRIVTVKQSANTVVKAIVNQGVEQGLEVDKIVKNIQQYVHPDPNIRSRPPRSYAGLRRNVRYGSVEYNALRIARTESARTYREIQTTYYDKFDFIIGYRWILSGRHKGVDQCDSFAGKVYKTSELPSSHPNCLCDILTVIDKSKAFGLTPEAVDKIFA